MSNGNKKVFSPLAASNHSKEERADLDYYATHPEMIEQLLKVENFKEKVWEPACGGGHIAEILKNHGKEVYCSDITDRGHKGTVIQDFFDITEPNSKDIITNPPYYRGKSFVEHALDISTKGTKIAMLLKLTFLEGKERYRLFKKYPFRKLYVFSSRRLCGKNGVFDKTSSAVAYGWFVWEKGFNGNPEIFWIW